jgi:DnaK suppressor protein
MDADRARHLLGQERTRVEGLLAGLHEDREEDREAVDESGDWSDPAEPLTVQGADDAVAIGLEERLRAITRAEQRLTAGTYGRSVRSGRVIPDPRFEADPAAELTVEEAAGQV